MENKNNFLPEDYKLPESRYMKLVQGDNRFRIMSSPIIGNEFWTEVEEKRKPIRRRMNENIEVSELLPYPNDKISHFWAFVVWNYQTNKLMILELKQKGVMKAITGLSRDEDWGSPVGNEGYDIVVNKTGEKMATEYSVIAKPKKKLADEIITAYEEANIDLEELFKGGDPFKTATNTIPSSNTNSVTNGVGVADNVTTEVDISDFDDFLKKEQVKL